MPKITCASGVRYQNPGMQISTLLWERTHGAGRAEKEGEGDRRCLDEALSVGDEKMETKWERTTSWVDLLNCVVRRVTLRDTLKKSTASQVQASQP